MFADARVGGPMSQDVPEPLDDTSWIAVKGGTVEAIVRALDLSDPKAATWTEGMEVVGGNHDNCPADWGELAGVYITPLVHGWRLAVGHYVGAAPISRPADDRRTGWRKVAGWCRRLSREFGEAHAFTDQAQMDWFSWIVARDGTVIRQVVYEDGEFLSNRGSPSGVEARLVARFRPDEDRSRWLPDVGDVPRLAGECSVNPWRIGPRTRLVGPGFVAVTPWGRRQGVVFAGLA
jgi:hypothetical protein